MVVFYLFILKQNRDGDVLKALIISLATASEMGDHMILSAVITCSGGDYTANQLYKEKSVISAVESLLFLLMERSTQLLVFTALVAAISAYLHLVYGTVN